MLGFVAAYGQVAAAAQDVEERLASLAAPTQVRTSSEYDRRGAASHAAGLMQDTKTTTVAVQFGA